MILTLHCSSHSRVGSGWVMSCHISVRLGRVRTAVNAHVNANVNPHVNGNVEPNPCKAKGNTCLGWICCTGPLQSFPLTHAACQDPTCFTRSKVCWQLPARSLSRELAQCAGYSCAAICYFTVCETALSIHVQKVTHVSQCTTCCRCQCQSNGVSI